MKYWAEEFTETVAEHVLQAASDPREQLLALMKILGTSRYHRDELAVRGWASHDAVVATTVRSVDRRRLQVVRGLFRAMGFEGPELDMRARTLVGYHSIESALAGRQSRQARQEALALLQTRYSMMICGSLVQTPDTMLYL